MNQWSRAESLEQAKPVDTYAMVFDQLTVSFSHSDDRAGGRRGLASRLDNSFEEETKPPLPVALLPDRHEPVVVLGPVALQIEAEVEERTMQDAAINKQERDQEAPHSPVTVVGIFIGNGDQDNYAKLVVSANGGSGGVSFLLESGGSASAATTDSVSLPGPSAIDLYLEVNPASGTVQPWYTVTNGGGPGPRTNLGGPVSLAGPWFAASMFVGIISTSSGPGHPFSATWDLLEVSGGRPSLSGAIGRAGHYGAPRRYPRPACPGAEQAADGRARAEYHTAPSLSEA